MKQTMNIQQNLFNLHKDLPVLTERKKIECEKLLCNIYNRENYVESLKTSIKSWVNTKKVHRLIQFNQEAWLKP